MKQKKKIKTSFKEQLKKKYDTPCTEKRNGEKYKREK